MGKGMCAICRNIKCSRGRGEAEARVRVRARVRANSKCPAVCSWISSNVACLGYTL